MQVANQFRFAADLFAALFRLGLRHVCVSPGSRNTPLSMAAATSRFEVGVHLDERSAAFWALGMAKATRTPVALISTSGTAAVEYHPAVVEAHEAHVPLLVITADRPAELVDTGAPQTIDQVGLYGPAVRWQRDLAVDEPEVAAAAPGIAASAWSAATAIPPGPIHLNVRLREPLVASAPPTEWGSPSLAMPDIDRGTLEVDDNAVDEVAASLEAKRVLIVAGEQRDPGFPAALAALATQLGAPVVADPLSGLRSWRDPAVIRTGDLLGQAGALERMAPEVVLRFGALPTSKAIWTYLERGAVPQIFVEPSGRRDPLRGVSRSIRAEPAALAASLAKRVGAAAPSWLEAWRALDDEIAETVRGIVADAPFPNEPAIAAIVAEHVPAGGVLFAGSSMPVRDLDAFGYATNRDVEILANRGANGIDGVLSSAAGACQATGRPTVALLGDLSTLHDLTGLAAVARLGPDITIVVVNNDGGGIFHFLPQARGIDSGIFETLFGTPHGTDFIEVANALRVPAKRIEDPVRLAEAVSEHRAGPTLIELRTDRNTNVDLHRRIVVTVRGLVAGAT